MDPSYRQTAYYGGAERDPQDHRHRPLQHQQLPPQQHPQHLQHYPHQLPYHPALLSPPQQAPFVVDQADHVRTREDYGSSLPAQAMLRSIYSGTGSVLSSPNVTLQPSSDQPLSYSPSLQHLTLLQSTSQASSFPPSVSAPTTGPPFPPLSSTSTTSHATENAPLEMIDNVDHTNTCTQTSKQAITGQDRITKDIPVMPLTYSVVAPSSQSMPSTHINTSTQPSTACPVLTAAQPSTGSSSSSSNPAPSTLSTIRQTILSHPSSIQPRNSTRPTLKPNQNVLTQSAASLKNILVLPSILRRRKAAREKEKAKEPEQEGSDLPDFLSFKFAPGEKENVVGVEAKEEVEKGTTFGPYDGNLLDEESGADKESTWELCLRGKVFLYIDGKRKSRSHMMSYIRCARNEAQQNLEAIQSFGDIYFRVTKVIRPGEELMVFYSEMYSDLVGFKLRLNELTYSEDDDNFQCSQCEKTFPSAKRVMRHVKFDHEIDRVKELCPIVTWMVKAKKDSDRTKDASKVVSEKRKVTEESSQKDRDSKHYVCTVCGKTFPSEGRLEAHAMFHEFTEEHTCPVCGERQRNTFMLTKHMARHVNRTHKCAKCDKAYKTRGALYRHERDMHGIPVVRNHVCRVCSTRFAKKLECLKHERTHKELRDVVDGPKKKMNAMRHRKSVGRRKRLPVKVGKDDDIRNSEHPPTEIEEQIDSECKEECVVKEAPVKVPKQSRRSKNKTLPQEPQDMLGKAADYYIKPRPFKCRYCSKRYVDKTKAYEHEKEVHEGKGTYKCTDCTKVFMNEARYLDHVKNHEQHRLYRCTLCTRSFASENALTNHQGEHTGQKPFKCDLCGRGFRVKNAVYQHKRRMHQIRPMRFFCGICNKGFPDKGGLTKHERRHKGIRPFVCLVCGKGFTVKHSLQVHMQSMHEEKRPFVCPICGKTFSLNHSFTSHMFRHKVQGEDFVAEADDIDQPQQ